MRRPSKPTPLSISDLSYNPISGKYEISENGIYYHMDLEHTRSLKLYFKGYYMRGNGVNVAGWYKKLDNTTKKEIERTGDIPTGPVDFYPDVSYE